MLETSQDRKIAALTTSYCVHFLCGDNMKFEFMKKCVDLAMCAYDNDEVPVGAVVIKNNEIIGCGYNRKESSNLCTRHAEIDAIENANRNINSWRLDGCVLYVTLEPCLMCCGAILESRIDRVIYLVKRTNVHYSASDYVKCERFVGNDVLSKEYLNVLSDFFKKKR